jgi:hypothetical protein
MNKLQTRRLGYLVAIGVLVLASQARAAAIDVSPVTSDIAAQVVPIALIGGAVLVLIVGVKAFKWLRAGVSGGASLQGIKAADQVSDVQRFGIGSDGISVTDESGGFYWRDQDGYISYVPGEREISEISGHDFENYRESEIDYEVESMRLEREWLQDREHG